MAVGCQSNTGPICADRVRYRLRDSRSIVLDVSEAVAAALAAGGGIGISPNYVAAPYVRRGELVPVLQPFLRDKFHITALWPESRRGNPNVKAFVAFLGELFAAPWPWDAAIYVFAATNPGIEP